MSTTLPPGQKDVPPLVVIVGAAGIGFTTTVILEESVALQVVVGFVATTVKV